MKTQTQTVADWAKAEVAALTPATAKGISEAEILAKTAAGLTREQAIEVIQSQRAQDATLSDATSGAGKTKPAKAK